MTVDTHFIIGMALIMYSDYTKKTMPWLLGMLWGVTGILKLAGVI